MLVHCKLLVPFLIGKQFNPRDAFELVSAWTLADTKVDEHATLLQFLMAACTKTTALSAHSKVTHD